MSWKHIIAVTALGLVIAGCSGSKKASTAADVPVNLVFTGQVAGTMTTATGALTAGKNNPTKDLSNLPAHTQCSTFTDSELGKDFVASIIGLVAGKQVKLSIEVNGDNAAYGTPGTPLKPGDTNRGGSTELQLPGDSTPRSSVVGPAGQEPAVIVLNAARTGGTIHAWYADSGMSQVTSTGTVHVAGTWRCSST